MLTFCFLFHLISVLFEIIKTILYWHDLTSLMNKKYLLISASILLVLLIIFFFPKKNNVWDDGFTASVEQQYKNMDCNCMGFTAMKSGLSKSDTQVQLCYGIPKNCEYHCKKMMDDVWQDVSCDQLV
jgi:hypothetical protein